MSTSALLLIALASVVLLLLLVIKAKAHPFVALLIVSLLVAFATGIPADKIITTIEKGMGGLLGHIASIIILFWDQCWGCSLKYPAAPNRWRKR